MNTIESLDYIQEATDKLEQQLIILDQLHDTLLNRELTTAELDSIAQSAEILIAIAIDYSRYYLKSKQENVPTEPYAIIEATYAQLAITYPSLEDMRAVIAIYEKIMNNREQLDWQHIQKILRRKKYHLMKGYIVQLLKQLQKSRVN